MSDTDIEYGPPHVDDLARIVELVNGALGPRYRSSADDPRCREVVQRYCDGDGKGAVVARHRGVVVGLCFFDITPILAPTYLHARGDMMIVDPAYRGRGISTTMIRAAWRLAADRGASTFLTKTSTPQVLDWFRSLPELHERGAYFFLDFHSSLLEVDR
ncbi:GNAT family N-acetyltransferase [Umezawaea endophytica]|uniref:GNAT family N-acetyltransferase n=1 Tax=Umezawaea endophytica TaxID=1654476 RepID=A0A9X3A251_9PSEU|nr:GNAT family N-acetyltransferase [Umezawaea endophytica]MCS7480344.1 GNAT family N-acetyltransferase [Umezawaea endophytica]